VPEDRDVLLVGTGLTMVDVALSLVRPHRTVHAISRNGLLPRAHAAIPPPPIPPPEPAAPADLASARRTVLRHIATQRRTGRDWQAAVDGLRPVLSTWWQRLPAADQMRFLTRDRRLWDAHRHRIPADTAAEIERLRELGQLVVHTGKITAARQDGDDLLVRLSSGRILAVASVVNCTGPQEDMRRTGDPLLESLFTTGQARVGPASLGLDTARDGHVLPADGGSAGPLWTIGALRKGNLWETTAFAEIRDQADRIAIAVLTTVDMQDHIERAEV
jgi:uncharacterized NAD(P)/FAD-binding protein YdhS